jgi:hypothetical protein
LRQSIEDHAPAKVGKGVRAGGMFTIELTTERERQENAVMVAQFDRRVVNSDPDDFVRKDTISFPDVFRLGALDNGDVMRRIVDAVEGGILHHGSVSFFVE